MPLKLLLDENLRNAGLWLAIQTRNAAEPQPLNVIRVGDEGTPPCRTPDPDLIQWAATHDRVLISRDKSTLPRHLQNYLASGETSPGIVLLPEGMRISNTVELLFLIAFINEATEWANACRWTQ